MAYYECLSNNDHINIGDKFTVTLTGSHNLTTSATICYVDYADDITICLLGDTSLGNGDWSTQRGYSWNYSLIINGKDYTGICKIPTVEQIYSKCAGYKRDFYYWTSSDFQTTNGWCVSSYGGVSNNIPGYVFGTLPFIEITL